MNDKLWIENYKIKSSMIRGRHYCCSLICLANLKHTKKKTQCCKPVNHHPHCSLWNYSKYTSKYFVPCCENHKWHDLENNIRIDILTYIYGVKNKLEILYRDNLDLAIDNMVRIMLISDQKDLQVLKKID